MTINQRFIHLLFFAIVGVTAFAAQWKIETIPNVHLADSTKFVSNPDGVLSAATERDLNEKLRALQRSTSSEVAIVAVDEIDDSYDIDEFATKLFNRWGVGKSDKDNGVLLLLSKDSHEVTIRTGRGAEAVVPDIIAGRIIRNVMIPHFRNGDYDSGVVAAAESIAELLENPEAAAEMMSKYANNKRRGQDDDDINGDVIFNIFLAFGAGVGGVMLILVLGRIWSTRKLDEITRYRRLDQLSMAALFLSFLGLGFPLPAYLILKWKLRRIRNRKRNCENCGSPMRKLDELTDNLYLTSGQDMEERLDSVDYDVWLCDKCGNKEVIPFVNKASAYTQCPRCKARTYSMLSDRQVVPPTTMRDGRGVKTFSCRHCGFSEQKAYEIPKVAVAPPIIGGGGGNGGGGFGGGSFGGGISMGGGATGRW